MSTWFELVNAIKQRGSPELFTPTQSAAYESLCEWIRLPEWINLYGAPGSGKTFLAWMVSRAMGSIYLPTPMSLLTSDLSLLSIIIDNAPHKENDVRNLLSQCGLAGAETVLLVTNQRALLPMPSLELSPPTLDDIHHLGQVFNRLGFYFEKTRLPETPNFWDVLQASV